MLDSSIMQLQEKFNVLVSKLKQAVFEKSFGNLSKHYIFSARMIEFNLNLCGKPKFDQCYKYSRVNNNNKPENM